MADVPFLGCKISLISKCDIRYEGILYCVDAKESTIALSKVKSYGTETRGDPSCYVAPKNDVYDIIIFRASDVKDLRVDAPEPPGLSDPAIISAHQSHPGQSSSSFNNINNITTAAAATQATTNNSGAPTLISNGSLSATGPSNQQQQQSHQQQQAAQPQQNKHQPGQQQHQKPLLPFLPAGSKGEQLDQQNPNLPTINYSSAAANAQRRARTEQRDNKRSDDAKPSTHDSGRDQGRRDDRRVDTRDDRRDGRRDERRDDRRNDRRGDDRRPNRRDDRRGDRHDDVGRRGGGGGGGGDGRPGARMSRGGGFDRDRSNGNHVNSSNNMRYNNNRDNNRDINGYQSRRGGPNNRDSNNSKNGGPMYRRGPMQGGGRRGRSNERTSAPRGPRKGVPLKFEGEYDFDEANKLFLELDGKFKGLKIKGDADKDGAESSGEGNNSKSPAGQSESGSDYDSEDQNNKDGDSKDGCGESVSGEFYDKTKSFFDNISCEASERSQGKVNKPDWRKERQLNTETFGVSSSYRRGGYRGRVYGANGYHRR